MRLLSLSIVLACVGFVSGCKKEYEALPDTDCPKIIAHTKAILGDGAKGKTDEELLGVCKASTPKQRGCAMIATVGSDIMKCSLLAQ